MAAYYYDFETMSNLTVAVFVNQKDLSDERVFVIHELRNDFKELGDFLENCADNSDWLIGFNNVGFDGQITEAILRNRDPLEKLSPEIIAQKIYKKAQEIISTQEYGDFYNGVPEWKQSIQQLDLFKLNHWDFRGRMASLKWLQFTLDWHTVMEMPIHHSKKIDNLEEINQVVDYCKNDVLFLDVLYKKSKSLLQVRKDIKAKYKLNCYNYSNTKLGSEILLKMYCKKTKQKKWDVKSLSTKRNEIKVAELLFKYIKFKSNEFNNLLDTFNKLVIKNTKGEFKESVIFKGSRFDYGMGGIHQCIDSGIYKSDNERVIMDLDVASLYPSIACVNGIYPAHLRPEFCEVYKNDIVDIRLSEKAKGKTGNKGIIDGFKEAANAAYGSSNNKHSWLNDPAYTMQITINGQLLITMLVEAISLDLTDVQVLQTNTDGCTIKLLRSELAEYYSICREWEELTKLKLEFGEITSAFIPDVNSYLMVYVDGKIKTKGRYQWEDLEPHKNKSYLVVPKALQAFFIDGVFPEEYLKSNRNIFDYCGGARVTSEWGFWGTCVDEGLLSSTPLQKVIRYYISNKGCKITKVNKNDKRVINVVAGQWMQTEYNNHVNTPWENYDLDERFYLEMIRKEIEILQQSKSKQLELF